MRDLRPVKSQIYNFILLSCSLLRCVHLTKQILVPIVLKHKSLFFLLRNFYNRFNINFIELLFQILTIFARSLTESRGQNSVRRTL